MTNNIHVNQIIKTNSYKQITIISIVALVLAHLMLNTYIPNELVNLVGLIITSLFIYQKTLQKNDLFSFLMVIYFCSSFPYLLAKGGGFNMVSFVCIGLYLSSKKKLPKERTYGDAWFKKLVFLWVFSSVLGWLTNYTGDGLDFVYSFITFFGIIFLLLLSGQVEITAERIKTFLQLNVVIIIWSTIASINKYLNIIPFKTQMMPVRGIISKAEYFEGGGIIGSSPLYGEHSLILLVLFFVFLLFNMHTINLKRITLLVAAIISFINVFMSVSRSVFLLSIASLALIFLLQIKLVKIRISRNIQQIFILLLVSFTVFYFIQSAGINYVFDRMEQIEEKNIKSGGITTERILNGSAFNRETAFNEAKKRYASKNTWIIGYGWGLEKNNRDAFYVDPKIKRGSAHSQVFAILFVFGWIGFIGYWGLILRIIFKTYKIIGHKNIDYAKRMMAYFFLISFCVFTFNEIKADSISIPSYFAVTIIWMGMAYSTFSSKINSFPIVR